MQRLADAGRFEDAGRHRDRLIAFVRAAARRQRLGALAAVEELVAALPDGAGGWELSVIRHGRLVASGRSPAGAGVRPYVAALMATAETVVPGPGPLPAASAEEVECVLRWLERPGARLVECSGTWASPAFGAAGQREWLVAASERAAVPIGKPERRNTRPSARPARADTGSASAAGQPGRSGRARAAGRPDRVGGVVTAVVLIKAAVERIPEVAEAIAALDGVTEVYSVTGEVDLVAMVRVRQHEQLAEVIADRMNKVSGVTHTETLIAFRAYSRHDLQAAFSLGQTSSSPPRLATRCDALTQRCSSASAFARREHLLRAGERRPQLVDHRLPGRALRRHQCRGRVQRDGRLHGRAAPAGEHLAGHLGVVRGIAAAQVVDGGAAAARAPAGPPRPRAPRRRRPPTPPSARRASARRARRRRERPAPTRRGGPAPRRAPGRATAAGRRRPAG